MPFTEQPTPVHTVHPALTAEWVVALPDVPLLPSGLPPEPLPEPTVESPLPDPSPNPELPVEPQYLTKWRGAATMEDLLTDPQVRKVAFAKARSLGYLDQDAEDCFQLGSLKLWQTLQQQPTLLADKGPAWVGVWLTFAGSRRALWKHQARSVSLDHVHLPQSNCPERRATWATRVDERIDFELLIQTLATRYEADYLKLLALYALTTSVKMKDVAILAKVDKKRFAAVVGNEVKNDLAELLEHTTEAAQTDEFLTDQFKQGKNLECVRRVAEQVQANQRLLLALYIVTTSATRKEVTDLFNIGRTSFRKEVTQIKLLLTSELRKVNLRVRASA